MAAQAFDAGGDLRIIGGVGEVDVVFYENVVVGVSRSLV